MSVVHNFELERFKEELDKSPLKISETDNGVIKNILYILFEGSKVKYITVPLQYEGKHNCINIYHGESTKNGFWWNHKLNYRELVRELEKYHGEVV